MGSLHQLPTNAEAQARLLSQWVRDSIARHPEPRVAKLWSDMAIKTLSRFPGPPMPTHPELNLDAAHGLTDEQRSALLELTQDWMEHYFSDVHQQLMLMHGELLKLQCQIAESKLEIATDDES